MTAEGLRNMDLRLARVIENMAVSWLYFCILGACLCRKAIGKKGYKKIWIIRQLSELCMTIVVSMKKRQPLKISSPHHPKDNTRRVEETGPIYKTVKPVTALKAFTFSEFKKIADKAPLTHAEWAAVLHLSERTLQRYAKTNGVFAPIYAERALQLEKVLKEGKAAFGKTEHFYHWLKRKPFMLEGKLSFDSLTSYSGIEMVLTQLGRIQQGLFA